MLEYNPDQYDWEVSLGSTKPDTKLSAAIKWRISPDLSVTLSRQNNNEWGINLIANMDSKSMPSRPNNRVFRSSLDYPEGELPYKLDSKSWYDMLLLDTERSGLLLMEASLDNVARDANLVVSNPRYTLWADAISKLSILADLHLPRTVEKFNFVLQEQGHKVHSVSISRASVHKKILGIYQSERFKLRQPMIFHTFNIKPIL